MTSEERREIRYQRRTARRESQKQKYSKYTDFNWVFSYEHLYNSYKMCRRHVRWKASTQSFIHLAPLRVYRTYIKLKKGQYRSRGFFEFYIVERGKKRHIRSVMIDERVVQRCLCEYCLVPLLTPTFVYDNSASTKGKGYHFAKRRIVRFLRRHLRKYGTKGYALLFDFHNFFDTISHSLCKSILRKHIPDKRILALADHFIDMFGKVGLGLGSQISQILALASANELDHMIKEKMRVKHYSRYMDDGCLIHPNKERLKECYDEIERMCEKLGFTINKDKTQIVKLSHGFTWLKTKYYIQSNQRIIKKITRDSVIRMRRRLRSFRDYLELGLMTEEDIWMSFQSWRAYARTFDAYESIRAMEEYLNKNYPGGVKSKWQTVM